MRSAGQCYYRNGDIAVIGPQEYVQCPGLSSCCLPTDTCVSNGLCSDINNHADGSLTNQGGVNFNFTGLYQTPACANANFEGCDTECTASDSSSRAYVWACDNQLTDYCCTSNVGDQFDCCSGDSTFELSVASDLRWPSSTTSGATSSTTSTLASSTSLTSGTALSSSTAVSSLSATAPTLTVPTPTVSDSSPSPSAGSSSNGVKIGVGVGVPVGVLLLAGFAALFIYRRRRSRQRVENNDTGIPSPYQSHCYEQSSNHMEERKPVSYQPYAVEVDATRPPAELEGSGKHDQPPRFA